jgi:hypothetical protein
MLPFLNIIRSDDRKGRDNFGTQALGYQPLRKI